MLAANVLIGSVAGLIAATYSLFVGHSFIIALFLFMFVATAILVLLPIVRLLICGLFHRKEASDVSSRVGPAKQEVSGEASIDLNFEDKVSPIRILAVDDDPFILKLLPMISEEVRSSHLTIAGSGSEALDILESSEKAYDYLLFDIAMPELDGIELCKRVRKMPRYQQTPIVMLTAKRDMQNIGDAYRAGATDYATKPFDVEELATRLCHVQEKVQERRTSAKQEKGAPRFGSAPIPRHSFKLRESLLRQEIHGVTDQLVLMNYLTDVPKKNLADVHLYSIKLDEIENARLSSSSDELLSIIESLASATVEYFGTDRTLMALADDVTLLAVTLALIPASDIQVEVEIEARIKGRLAGNSASKAYLGGVSVGGPVQLQNAKSQRARTAIDRANALAEDRLTKKQGSHIAPGSLI